MKRWLLTIAVACSLLLSLAAAAAWATSHARPHGWRLIATAHSADLARANGGRRTALFTTSPSWSTLPNHGFWDAWWVLSRAGRLTLLAQVIDYEGILHRVHASPPVLVVELPGRAGPHTLALDRIPDTGHGAKGPGFAWHSDARQADGLHGPVGARAWMVTVPYWFVVLLGVPLPLRWLRGSRRRRAGA